MDGQIPKMNSFENACANAIAEATDLPKRSGKRVQCVPFFLKLLLIWRNVKDGTVEPAKATTTHYSVK